MVCLHGSCVRGLSDNKQETSFVHCMQVHAAGWCGRPNAHAGRFPASANYYAESVINVSFFEKQLHTCERPELQIF